MREIKFRGWVQGSMVPVSIINNYRFCGRTLEMDFEEMSAFIKLLEDIPIMQYTGIKDGSGKEIYEGDRVSFTVFDCFDNDTQYDGIIVYSGSRFMIWKTIESEYYGNDGGFDLDWTVEQDETFEVTGNIYENKELLERGEV
jgi:uncharacterized phage protein (TIGR01671 family)